MENNFYQRFTKIIRECSYDNTYKMAWAKSLVEICSSNESNNEKITITLDEIAQKFLKYYWNQTIFFDLIQGRNTSKPPVIVSLVKELINKYYLAINKRQPESFDKVKEQLNNLNLNIDYEITIKEIIKILKTNVSWRFDNVDDESNNLYEYNKNDDYLIINYDNIQILKESSKELTNLINCRWGLILESFNNPNAIDKNIKLSSNESLFNKVNKYFEFDNSLSITNNKQEEIVLVDKPTNLEQYNMICKFKLSKLESFELIEKILFSKDEIEEIGKLLIKRFGGFYHAWNIVSKYKEVITVFLVGCAKYFYNNGEGGFWDAVQRLTGYSQNFKNELLKSFKTTIKEYGLEMFEEEKVAGYTQMGSILAHSGLPENLEDSLIYNIISLKYQRISFDKLGDELLVQDFYMTKSIKSYLLILNKLGTLNDFIYDVLTLLDTPNAQVDEYINLPITLQEKIINFKTNKKNQEYTKQRVITRPELYLDTETNQFYINFPEHISEEDADLTWFIYVDEQIIRKNIISEFIKQKYYFRAATLKLNPGQNIKVSLLSDNNQTLMNYTVKEIDQPLVFNEKGEYVKNNTLTNKGGYVLVDTNYACEDVNLVETYDAVDLYEIIESKDKYNVVFKCEDKKDIKILIRNPIELIGEDKLFSQTCSFQGVDGFYTLPKISLPALGSWHIRMDVEGIIFVENLDIDEGNTILDLNDYISENLYGKVNIRLTHKLIGTKTFRFVYLPKLTVYWGMSSRNSKSSHINVRFEENDECFITDSLGDKKENYLISEEEDSFEGYYNYKDRRYSFRFNIRSFTWTFENNNQLLGTPNTMTSLSIKDLSANGSCLLTLKNNTNEDVYLILDNGTDERIHFKIKSNSRKFLNLKDYIEYLSSNTDKAFLYLEENFNKICDLGSVKKNIAIHNFVINTSYNLVTISWQEDGLKRNRVLRCRDVMEPYNYFDIDIPDGETSIVLDMDESGFTKNLILEIVFKKSKNIFEIGFEDEEILDESNTTIFNLYAETPYLFNFVDGDLTDLKNAIFTFITYKFNKKIFQHKEIRKRQLSNILTYIYLSRFTFGDERIVEILMNYKLTNEQYLKIRKDFGLLYPILRKDEVIKTTLLKKLEQYDKLLYVIYVFIKREEENLERVFFNNFSYLEKFKNKEKENIIWERYQDLLPGINNYERIEKIKQQAMKLFPDFKDIQLYIESLVSDFANVYNREKGNPEYRKLADYMEILNEKYSKTLMDSIFRQLSRRSY